jgi:hypothetical protein
VLDVFQATAAPGGDTMTGDAICATVEVASLYLDDNGRLCLEMEFDARHPGISCNFHLCNPEWPSAYAGKFIARLINVCGVRTWGGIEGSPVWIKIDPRQTDIYGRHIVKEFRPVDRGRPFVLADLRRDTETVA